MYWISLEELQIGYLGQHGIKGFSKQTCDQYMGSNFLKISAVVFAVVQSPTSHHRVCRPMGVTGPCTAVWRSFRYLDASSACLVMDGVFPAYFPMPVCMLLVFFCFLWLFFSSTFYFFLLMWLALKKNLYYYYYYHYYRYFCFSTSLFQFIFFSFSCCFKSFVSFDLLTHMITYNVHGYFHRDFAPFIVQ